MSLSPKAEGTYTAAQDVGEMQQQKDPFCNWSKIKEKLIAQHLLVFLAIAFIIGLAWPDPGEELSKGKVEICGKMRVMPSINVILIFFISGMRLKTDEVLQAIKEPMPLLTAMILILVITPCVGFIPANGGFNPTEFQIGFAIFCCVPTTLTSGAALVAQGAQKSTVLALMITMITNLLGTLTVPFVLKLVLSGTDSELDPGCLLVKLLLLILVPSSLGKSLTHFYKPAADFSKKYKSGLTMFSNASLVMVVWQTLSRSRDDIVDRSASEIFGCIGFGVALHIIFWIVALPVWFLPCGFSNSHQRRAVWLLASQKTLPVSMAVIAGLGDESGEQGLITLPCIIGHLSQLIIDSFVVSYWIKKDKEEEGQGTQQPIEMVQPLADQLQPVVTQPVQQVRAPVFSQVSSEPPLVVPFPSDDFVPLTVSGDPSAYAE
eukprot:TRINITY_DN27858_c0_g1_i1.p1 TRINITY_DN27858_c0_g1~~TRINITY_DN27858_c0_g1_i1.p1  ORF type:complete len:433 (+),score=81.05 TRINITY_DN27858_c0_g1_i1:39-1337(+)